MDPFPACATCGRGTSHWSSMDAEGMAGGFSVTSTANWSCWNFWMSSLTTWLLWLGRQDRLQKASRGWGLKPSEFRELHTGDSTPSIEGSQISIRWMDVQFSPPVPIPPISHRGRGGSGIRMRGPLCWAGGPWRAGDRGALGGAAALGVSLPGRSRLGKMERNHS